MKKLKRSVGRPPKELQQIYAMDDAQGTVKEIFADRYLEAMRYIADLVVDDKASPNLRFTAAKTVKDQVEAWLEEHHASMEAEDDQDDSESEAIVI